MTSKPMSVASVRQNGTDQDTRLGTITIYRVSVLDLLVYHTSYGRGTHRRACRRWRCNRPNDMCQKCNPMKNRESLVTKKPDNPVFL